MPNNPLILEPGRDRPPGGMPDLLLIRTPRKILIIKPSALGDVIHSLPFLHNLKKLYPDARIHWVIAKGLEGLLQDHPLIERTWIIDKSQWKRLRRLKTSWEEIQVFKNGLQAEVFDLVIDLQGLLRSGLVTWASKAPVRIGFKEAKEGSRLFYTHTIEGGRQIHAVDRYLKILQSLGSKEPEIHFPFGPLAPRVDLLNTLPAEYIVMAPSAGKSANMWPAERFAQLAARFSLPSVLVSSKQDAPVTHRVKELAQDHVVDLGGKTDLEGLIAVIQKARFVVSNDTGPMHIAAAFNVPVAAIFGPANPVRTGPYGAIHTIVREDLDCSPCYRKKRCRQWKCIQDLSVEKVYQAIKSAFNRRHPQMAADLFPAQVEQGKNVI